MNGHERHFTICVPLLLVSCLLGCNSQDATYTNPQIDGDGDFATDDSASHAGTETTPEFTATELAEQFLADSAGASVRHDQKRLIVSGTARGAVYVNEGLDYCSFGLVGLDTPDGAESDVQKYYIECRFKGAKAAEGIEKGQAVRVEGRFVNNIGGQILLHDCKLLE